MNLVQSLAINLPHTTRSNLQFTIIVFKTLAIVSEHPSRVHCYIDNMTKKSVISVHNDKRTFHSDDTDTDIYFGEIK